MNFSTHDLALTPDSSFLMADLVGFLADQLIQLKATHQDLAENSLTETAFSLYSPEPNKTSSQNTFAFVFVLICANLGYFALMLTLLGIYAKIKKERKEHHSFCTTLTLEEKQAGWTSVSNFLFLQLSLMCRLVTCALILTHVMGLVRSSSRDLPISALRIFYYCSVVFFYVACSLNIYEWLLIIHRVNFFGGLTSRNDYRKRARINKVTYCLIATLVGAINIAIIFMDAFDPGRPTSLALTMTITVVFSTMLIIFTVVGSVLIHRLGLFFKSNYEKQRISLLTALLLMIASLLVLTIRYGLEYAYLNQRHNSAPGHVPVWLLIAFLVVSDFGPLVAQMYCMWLAKKGHWDDLISGFLEPPFADSTVDEGCQPSVILGDLKREMSFQRFRSELLDSDCDWGSEHRDVIGTSLVSRSSFDLAAELARSETILDAGSRKNSIFDTSLISQAD